MASHGETGNDGADPLLGQTIAHFRVLAPLGRGGMGVVYRAEDVDLWREVALKLLPPHWADDGDRRLLFLREARSAASVTHANIATVYEAGTDRGATFIAMELVRGPTLREELARGIDPARALSIAVGIARGLSRAHEAGVLHRDLKPENVMLDPDGEPKLLDFGLARTIAREASVHACDTTLRPDGQPPDEPTDGMIAGTPGYMSPEQARGQPVDARSDVFGLGILLFELFSGRLPFASGSPVEMIVSVIADEPLSLETFGAAAPVVAIVGRCLARDPEARFASAGEVRDALTAVRAQTPGGPERSYPRSRSMVDEPGARLSDLPASTGAFFGRGQELADVIGRFDSRARLVTLVGPGGIGKTRLVREVAARLESRDRRPTVAVALGSSSTVEAALLTIAAALGIHFAAGVDPHVSLGLSLRARGPLLLLLDEADAIADVLPESLWTCLASAPDTTMLVTSRVRSREPRGEIIELAPLEPTVGAELFLARAGAVRKQLRADDPETRALAEQISERLDGSPLAIELAAARAEVLAPAAILERLDDRLRLLRTTAHTGRHGSLLAVLEWSWSLLDDVERQVIAQMSVFRGGATAEAAEAIVLPALEGVYVLDVLASLRAHSLVRLVDDEQGDTRFVIDESVRVYAEQRLRADAAEATSTRRRHASWLAARAREARASASLGIDASGDRWLVRERENLLACVDDALADEGAALDDAAQAIAALGGALQARSGLESLRGRVVALTARADSLSPEAAADLLATNADLEVDRAPSEACALATRACEMASGVGDPALSSRARAALGMALFRSGQYEASAAVALEALLAARVAGAPHLEEVALAGLARAYARSEKNREARATAEDAVRSAEARGARRKLPALHHVLGFVLLQSDDLEAAVRHSQAAIDGARELGLDWIVAVCSMNIGSALPELGRFDEGRTHLAYAIERFELRGEPSVLALAHANAGLLEHMVGNLVLARSHHDRAIALLHRIGERRNRALFTAARAAVHAQMDHIEDAQRDLETAHDLARTLDERVVRVAVSLLGAHLELARARRTVDPREKSEIVASVREAIRTMRTNDAEGSPLAKRSDVIRMAASSLEWVMRADGHPV